VRAALFQRVGADRVLLGADYPVGDDDPVGLVKSAVRLSNAALQMIAGGTAARLLGIEVAQPGEAARSA
jgi:aminocarboxymuconate-semialdehyde decarboxylase